MKEVLLRNYKKIVIDNALQTVLVLLMMAMILSFFAHDFRLDASSDSLVLEGDEDLKYYREMSAKYKSDDYVIVTYTPKEEIFSEKSIKQLKQLDNELRNLPRVASVVNILNVPLLRNPPVSLAKLVSNIKTLEHPQADYSLAREELLNSPIYKNLILSEDGKTTAIQVNFKVDDAYLQLQKQREALWEVKTARSLNEEETERLGHIEDLYQQRSSLITENQHQNIESIRAIMERYRHDAILHLGGVPMISDDMITFIKGDIVTFGTGVLVFLIAMLSVIFRKLGWVLLPMICCVFSGIVMVGLLGLLDWRVTVISSNFISLMLIITMSLTIHLIVRYQELRTTRIAKSTKKLIIETMRTMVRPCSYTTLTTMVAFGSLVVSDIPPVVDFGWMMIIGVAVTFIATFLLFPSGLMLLKRRPTTAQEEERSKPLTLVFARITEKFGGGILVLSLLIFIFSGIGISNLKVENSFIDYFSEDTEIYQGMTMIDQSLGGTTPLDVIITLPNGSQSEENEGVEDEFDDEFDDDFAEDEEQQNGDKYWFTSEKVEKIKQVHNYLQRLPETGKVLSLASMMMIAESFNDNKPLNNFQLALLYSKIPQEFKTIAIAPFVFIGKNEVRFSIRVRESDRSLRRSDLLQKIRDTIITEFGYRDEQIKFTGMLVLYNNMLQSLFTSQILTLGVVLLAILVMFIVLFRCIKLAMLGLIPNLLGACLVLGIMGWMGIPLDIMTITIAAISVGIGVDNTIHYIHRFKKEFEKDRNYIATVYRCHSSIAKALFYTSMCIIVGFSILALSNFIPTIYFGLLTGLAMLVALVASLTLLPQLLIFFKPLGKSKESTYCA